MGFGNLAKAQSIEKEKREKLCLHHQQFHLRPARDITTEAATEVRETTRDPEEPRGIYKGSKLDPSVYGYVLEVICDNGETYETKGNVTLLR